MCAHYARVAAAVFRTHGVPARVRVGFAAYFVAGSFEDHWVTEYRDRGQWRLLDAQLDAETVETLGIGFAPWDVPRTEFLDAPAAWLALREGRIAPARIGVTAVGLAGAWFAAQSVLRDAAALDREEMLPWDTWGPGRRVGPHLPAVPDDFSSDLDRVAAALAGSPDAGAVAQVHRDAPWLRVTPSIFTLAFPRGWPDGVPAELALPRGNQGT